MIVFCFSIIIGVALSDLWMKKQVEKKIKRGEEIPVCKERIIFRHVHNEGMALNLGDKHPKVVRCLSFFLTCMVGVYTLCLFGRNKKGLEKISLSLLIAGAISNLYDRMKRKYVVDYIGFQTKWKKFTNITFNIGDFSIFVGAIGFVLSCLKNK